jgi:surface-anchored protein
MKMNRIVVALMAVASVYPATSQTMIPSGHVDIGVLYESGVWDLHVHKEIPEPEEEFGPSDAVFVIGAKAQQAGGVPNSASATAFFSPAGSPLWILPKSQDPELPFLGIGAEEMSSDDWNGSLTLTMTEVRGPGDVFVWDVGAFGDLQPKMSSRDGFSAGDALTVEAGGHAHYFWAFSAPGDYEVFLSAQGDHALDGPVQSEPAGYRFQVVPEPGVGTLVLAGLVCLGGLRRRSWGRSVTGWSKAVGPRAHRTL